MVQSRTKTALVSMSVLALCVLTLALPVAAQVSGGGASRVYQEVRTAPLVAMVMSVPVAGVSEPLGLSLLGVVLAACAHTARRRLGPS